MAKLFKMWRVPNPPRYPVGFNDYPLTQRVQFRMSIVNGGGYDKPYIRSLILKQLDLHRYLRVAQDDKLRELMPIRVCVDAETRGDYGIKPWHVLEELNAWIIDVKSMRVGEQCYTKNKYPEKFIPVEPIDDRKELTTLQKRLLNCVDRAGECHLSWLKGRVSGKRYTAEEVNDAIQVLIDKWLIEVEGKVVRYASSQR